MDPHQREAVHMQWSTGAAKSVCGPLIFQCAGSLKIAKHVYNVAFATDFSDLHSGRRVLAVLYRAIKSNVLFGEHRVVVIWLLETGQARYTQLALYMNVICKGHLPPVADAATTWQYTHVGKPPCRTELTWGCYPITVHAAENHMQHDVLFTLGLHVARRCNRDTHQPVPFQGLALCKALVSNRP